MTSETETVKMPKWQLQPKAGSVSSGSLSLGNVEKSDRTAIKLWAESLSDEALDRFYLVIRKVWKRRFQE